MKPLRRWPGWPALLLALLPLLGGTPKIAGAASAGEAPTAAQAEAVVQAAALKPRTVSWITLSREYPGAFATRGPAGIKRVALTFDDVPDEQYTPEVLDILAREHVRATFFVVGERAAKAPSVLCRIRAEGHAIGNHSYDHTSYAHLPPSKFEEQIESTSRLLRTHLGFTPRFLRPPYGEITPRQLMWTQSRGYFVVNWDVDTQDWRGLSADQIVRNAQKTLAPGSIILQHAGGGIGEDLSGTVKALPRLIRMLRDQGYEMVTVPELLGESEEIEKMRLY